MPPSLATKLLKGFTSFGDEFNIIDTLQEIYHHKHDIDGKRKADFWYWRQVLCSTPKNTYARLIWSVIMFKNYLKFAFRNLYKHKGYSFINITGLAIGISCFILILLYVQYEFSFDRFHNNSERIYRLNRHVPGHFHSGNDKMAYVSLGAAPAIDQAFPEVDSFVRVDGLYEEKITVEDKSFFEDDILFADTNFFDFFSFELIHGQSAEVLSDPNMVVISEHIRQKYFGAINPVGKVLRLDDDIDITIQGVMADMPLNTQFKSNFIISLQTYALMRNIDLKAWRGSAYSFIRLSKDVEVSTFEEKMRQFLVPHMKERAGTKPYLFLRPLRQIHLRTDLDGELAHSTDVTTLTIFGTVSVLILVVACINYMNLTTARSAIRMKEVGIRKVVGAQRWQLGRQFFGETFFLTLVAYVLAIGIVFLALPMFNRFVGSSNGLAALCSYPIGFWVVLSLLGVGFFSGIYPAFVLSRFMPEEVLKSRFMHVPGHINLRAILVVFQFAVSIILLVSILVVKKQLHYIRKHSLGYDKEQIVLFQISDSRVREKLDVIKNDLARYPHIQMVSSSWYPPNVIRGGGNIEWPGMSKALKTPIYVNETDNNFIDMYGLEIVEGRNFSKESQVDNNGAFLINETAAQIVINDLGWDRVIGHELIHFWDNNQTGQIVGVFKDYHFHSLHRPIEPLYFYFRSSAGHRYLSIKIDSHAIPETIERIKKYLVQYPTNYPFEYQFFDHVFDWMYRSEIRLEQIFSLFALLAILIAAMGLLGLVSCIGTRRTKEIGVRKVLGASGHRIFILLIQGFMKWIVLANIIAWPIAYYLMNEWLQNFAYRVNLSVWIFILSGLMALAIVILTISYQSIKAARANPVDSLKYE